MVTLILLNFLKSLYKLRLLLDNINIYNYFKQRGTAMRPQPPEEKRRKNSLKENIELIKDFFPYLKEHIPTLTMVLLCTAFSAACEIVLPLIVREITNTATSSLAALTLQKIVKVCFST